MKMMRPILVDPVLIDQCGRVSEGEGGAVLRSGVAALFLPYDYAHPSHHLPQNDDLRLRAKAGTFGALVLEGLIVAVVRRSQCVRIAAPVERRLNSHRPTSGSFEVARELVRGYYIWERDHCGPDWVSVDFSRAH